MYVTRRLSEYQRNRSELNQPTSEGPNSGVLIIQDEESKPTCCFGSCYESGLKGLPFPQNAKLTVNYTITVTWSSLIVIPSFSFRFLTSRYLLTVTTPLKEAGNTQEKLRLMRKRKTPCCFCFTRVPEAKPQQADPYDIYQQFEIHQPKSSSRYYFATSVAPDGVPPEFLKRKYWTVEYSTSEDYGLRDDAKGVHTKLRSELPSDLNRSVVVGNWYVPFIFVNERDAKDQLKSSTYYSMTLYQKWEEVYSCENAYKENREVVVNVEVEPEVVKLEGQDTGKETRSVDESGVVWFGVGDKRIGLRSVVIERMKWEEERFGWKTDPQRAVVKTLDRFNGGGSNWKSYRCYVLVESFVLRRMDESLVLTFEFRHADRLKSKWES